MCYVYYSTDNNEFHFTLVMCPMCAGWMCGVSPRAHAALASLLGGCVGTLHVPGSGVPAGWMCGVSPLSDLRSLTLAIMCAAREFRSKLA